MRNIIWFLALLVLLFIQAGILSPLHITPVSLVLIIVALSTILSDFNQGLAITLMGGLLLDFISGSPDGLMSMSLVTVFLIMNLILNELLSREPNRYILAAVVAGSTVSFFLAYLLFYKLFGIVGLTTSLDIRYLLTVLLPLQLMWNLLFSYPIFIFYSFIQNLGSRLPSNEEPIRN